MALKGVDAHVRRIRALAGQQAVQAVGGAIFAGAQAIQVDVQISITTGSVSGANHVPSAPGQPPNNDTGTLANNIEAVMTGPLSAEVSSEAPYGVHLEFGTSKMAERPYMRPAVAKRRGYVVKLVQQAFRKLIQRGS